MPFAAVAAVFAGDLAVATIAMAVVEVGTAVSVVGAVTGDKTLMAIGSVMGIAGGIGGAVAGLGEAGMAVDAGENMASYADTASAANGGYDGAVATAQGTDFTANAASNIDGLSSPDVSIDPSSPSSGLNTNLSADLNNPLDASAPASDAPSSTIAPDAAPYTSAPSGNNAPIISTAQASPGAPANSMPLDASTGSPVPPTTAAGDNTAASKLTEGQATSAQNTNVSSTTAAGKTRAEILAQFPDSPNSYFDSIKGFVKNNQSMLGQMASGALSGMGKAYEADKNFRQKSIESDRNYAINKSLLDLRTQQQGYGNTAPSYNFNASGVRYGAATPVPPGIINGARSK